MPAIDGTSLADTLSGTEENDVILGYAGNDSISNDGAGDDIVDGGEGDDVIRSDYSNHGNDIFRGGEGNDLIEIRRDNAGASETLTVLGGSGADTLHFHCYGLNELVADMGDGDDRIVITGGYDRISATLGSGSDTFALPAGYSTDTIAANISITDFAAGPGGDRIEMASYLSARLIRWDGVTNPFAAGYLRLVQSGNDTLLQIDAYGQYWNFVTLVTLQNTRASDFTAFNLGGLANRAPYYGSSEADTIYGSSAANEVRGGDGADFIDGRNGDDGLYGEAGDDQLLGGLGDDRLFGGHDNDTLRGGSGADRLEGGDGNDFLDGGVGADVMVGGLGDDIYIVDLGADQVVELAGEGTDLIRSFGVTIVLANMPAVENVTMVRGTADIYGNDLANRLTGSEGANLIAGGLGDDVLRGNGGADTLDGGEGMDNLFGGAGVDMLTGGAGLDRFYFGAIGESSAGPVYADRITDFSQAEHDRIMLSGIDAIAGGSDDAFTFIGAAGFSGTAGELRYRFDANHDTVVMMDVNGDGVVDMSIVLTGEIALTAGDFVL